MFDIWKKLILVTYGRRSRLAGCRSGETRERGRVLVSERARAGDGSPSFSFVQRLRELLERSEALYTFLQLSLSLSLLCPLLALRKTFMATSISVRVKNRSSPLRFASQRRRTDFHGWSGLPNKHHRRSPSHLELEN